MKVKIFSSLFQSEVEAQVNEFLATHTNAQIVNSYNIGQVIYIVVSYTEETSTTN